MGLCSFLHGVYSFSLSLCVGKRAVFLALFPGFTAIYSYKVFALASVITKEIVQ